jgi:hypothetical protein
MLVSVEESCLDFSKAKSSAAIYLFFEGWRGCGECFIFCGMGQFGKSWIKVLISSHNPMLGFVGCPVGAWWWGVSEANYRNR